MYQLCLFSFIIDSCFFLTLYTQVILNNTDIHCSAWSDRCFIVGCSADRVFNPSSEVPVKKFVVSH